MAAEPGRPIPAPLANPESGPFWAAARDGTFLIKGCTACGRNHWYPRAICPHCCSDRTEWRASTGTGTIYSVSVVKRAPHVYAIAYVTLDDGPTMLTNIVDCDFDTLAIGRRVMVTFKPAEDGTPYPQFRPV